MNNNAEEARMLVEIACRRSSFRLRMAIAFGILSAAAANPPAVAEENAPATSTRGQVADAGPTPTSGTPTPLPIEAGAWVRVGSTLQGNVDPGALDDWHTSSIFPVLHTGGHISSKVGVTLNVGGEIVNPFPTAPGSTSGPIIGDVGVLDAIISFDFLNGLHLWAGRLLVPVDRANFAGPFFMIPWNYPGLLAVGQRLLIATPKEGLFGRSNGAVLWGNLVDDRLTYLVGAFGDETMPASPLYSGRLGLALWDREPGFWGNSTYYGAKNILSVGVGGQYQKNGSGPGTDWTDLNADLLFEKRLPSSSVVTVEGAYYHFNVVDGAVDNMFYALAAFATPIIGVGNIQPMVRYQWAGQKNVPGTHPWNLDAAVSYLVKGPALRVVATYSHTHLPGGPNVTGNALTLAAQALLF